MTVALLVIGVAALAAGLHADGTADRQWAARHGIAPLVTRSLAVLLYLMGAASFIALIEGAR